LDRVLKEKERRGMAFHLISVEIECEMLIPVATHCGFLTSWEGLVQGSVRLEYTRSNVRWPARRSRRRQVFLDDEEDEWESDEDSDDEDGEGEEDCVGWEGWPVKWPKTVEEMREG
jgi:hypothetical protein